MKITKKLLKETIQSEVKKAYELVQKKKLEKTNFENMVEELKQLMPSIIKESLNEGYYESAAGQTINKDRVEAELKNHHVESDSEDYELFWTEVAPIGEDEEGPYWGAQEVLRWLGY